MCQPNCGPCNAFENSDRICSICLRPSYDLVCNECANPERQLTRVNHPMGNRVHIDSSILYPLETD